MIENLKKNKGKIVAIIILILLYILCSFFPYTGDDWAWGSSLGIDRLKTFFKDYNGRYAGNLLVILLTRFRILRNIVVSITLFGIACLSYKITNRNRYTLFLLSILLILTIPKLILRQAIVWTSGFTNYAFSTVLMLIAFYLMNKEYETKNQKKLLNIFLILLGFCTSLFVEHVTIYVFTITLIFMLYEFIKNKKIDPKLISYFIGVILGCILMFSNGAYTNIINSNDTYRRVPTNGIFDIIKKINENIETIYNGVLLNNVVLNTVLCVLLMLIAYNFLENRCDSKKKRLIVYCSIISTVGYTIYSIIKTINPDWYILRSHIKYFEITISLAYMLAIFLLILLCVDNKKAKQRIIFYLSSIIILTLPLFVVQPIGSRCFFAGYCMFILVVLELYNTIVSVEKDKMISELLFLITITCFIYLISIYRYIDKVDRLRMEYLITESSKGEKIVEVMELPYDQYVWCPDPSKDIVLEERTKLFYNIPLDVKIEKISINDWLNKVKK